MDTKPIKRRHDPVGARRRSYQAVQYDPVHAMAWIREGLDLPGLFHALAMVGNRNRRFLAVFVGIFRHPGLPILFRGFDRAQNAGRPMV